MTEQKNNLAIPVSILLAGFLIAGGIYLSSPNKGTTPIVKTGDASQTDVNINPVLKTEHLLGNPDALVTVVEYSDTECPYCKIFATTMNKIMDTYGKDGKVAWVYRPFLVHSKSKNEAEATECVNELGGNTAFWKMLDTIYLNTPGNDGLDAGRLPGFAAEAGVDVTKFNECLSSGKYSSTVDAYVQGATKAGVNGTPSSFLVVKNAVSNDTKNKIDDYAVANKLIDNQGNPLLYVSLDKKIVAMNGALPLNMVQAILDIILK